MARGGGEGTQSVERGKTAGHPLIFSQRLLQNKSFFATSVRRYGGASW